MTTFPLQQAIYDALNTDSALATLMGLSESPTDVPVFDGQAPNGQAMPYLIFGGGSLTTDDTKDADWSDQRVVINTYSDYRGYKEVRQIMDGVKAALHDQALTVAGNTLVELYLTHQDDFPEGDLDSLVRHGVQIFRAMTVEA